MEWAPDPFPPIGDQGGGCSSNFFDGEFAGALLPGYLDKEGTRGSIQVLRMQAVVGVLPCNPFVMRKTIEKCVGTKIDGAFPEGKEGISYVLKVRSTTQATKLMKLTTLIDGTGVKVTEHPTLNISRCVVNCRAVMDLADKILEEELFEQGVRGFRRITKRVGKDNVNTSTLILTIAGTVIPAHIDFGYIRCKTRPYFPAPMQCYNCWGFGHTSKRCQQSHATCGTCSKDHTIDKENPCQAEVYCKRCDRHSHSLASRKCPVYGNENEIQKIRVNQGISYPAARRLFEQANNQHTFSSVTVASKDQQIADLSSKVDKLLQEMEAKNKRIESLEVTLNGNIHPGNNGMIAELLQKVDLLTSEMRKKDERIQILEAALQSGSRMEIVRKHGTIEDLVTKVNDLELQLKQKEREVYTFQSLFQKRSQSHVQHSSNVAQQSTDNPAAHSQAQNQIDIAPTNSKKNKNRKQKVKESQLTPMYESDTSPIPSEPTSVERTPKRDRAVTDSDESSGQPKNKVYTPNCDLIPNVNISTSSGDDDMSDS